MLSNPCKTKQTQERFNFETLYFFKVGSLVTLHYNSRIKLSFLLLFRKHLPFPTPIDANEFGFLITCDYIVFKDIINTISVISLQSMHLSILS